MNVKAETRTVTEPAELLAFLFASWPERKKKQVREWLKYEFITVNGKVTRQFNHALKPGDVVAVRKERFAEPNTYISTGIRILHEDAHLVVIEKPEGLLTMATDTVQKKTAYYQLTEHIRTQHHDAQARVWIVHRLDRETSGLLVFARTEEIKRRLQGGWEQAEKRYWAIVEGRMPARQGTLQSHLDESQVFKVYTTRPGPETREAITHYKVVKAGTEYSLVELTLVTGRRHQIRVQLAEAGCPVMGDRRYGAKTDPAKRIALHACYLAFIHPESKQPMIFESKLPAELRKWSAEHLAPKSSFPDRKAE